MLRLVIDKPGSYIQKEGNRFIIKEKDTKKEYSADKIGQLIFAAPSAVSSEAVKLAIEKNIDLVYLDRNGNPFARTYRPTLGGTTLTRKKQLEATVNIVGKKLILKIVDAKVKSQLNYLKSLAKDRKDNLELNKLSKTKIPKVKIDQFKDKDMNFFRSYLLGLEGSIAAAYFKGLSLLTGYKRRDAHLHDEFNTCLNYAYGILYSEVERACVLAGLDPYLGFYHTDRYGKPCLVLDIIEIFRVAVGDRAVITLLNRKEIKNGDFDRRGTLTLSDKGKKKIIASVIKRLNTKISYKNKKYMLKDIILLQARELASFLLGHKRDFKPFVYKA